MKNEGNAESGMGNGPGTRSHSPFPSSHFRFVSAFSENIALAFGALRASKMRSALTILGVVIGVSCVMAMASIVRGIQDQILRTIDAIAITQDTPMTTPRIVSADRILEARSAPKASAMFSPNAEKKRKWEMANREWDRVRGPFPISDSPFP